MPAYALEYFQEFVYYDGRVEGWVEKAKYFLNDF